MTSRWDLYRSFLAILREGNLSRAARRLGLTQPTLGRHLDQLERDLGLPLFLRSPSGLSPTPAALSLAASAEAMDAAAEALTRHATAEAEEIAGTVRITASEIIGVEVLPPMLSELSLRHPKLSLELSISNLNHDLLRRDADVAVRMVRPTQAALVARHVGDIPIGLFAHQSYIRRRGVPSTPQDLADHALIGFDRESQAQTENLLGVALARHPFTFRCDNHLGQLAALRAGCGVGVCQTPLARGDPNLVRVLDDIAFPLPAWVVMHEDQRGSRRIRAVFDHLTAQLDAYLRS